MPKARSIFLSAKRIALVGLLALASHALLPYVHSLVSDCGVRGTTCNSDASAPSHSPECPVCSAIAHGGARALDAPSAHALLPAAQGHEPAAPAPVGAAPRVERDVACARAPPASRLSA